jgi:hypothetical protein
MEKTICTYIYPHPLEKHWKEPSKSTSIDALGQVLPQNVGWYKFAVYGKMIIDLSPSPYTPDRRFARDTAFHCSHILLGDGTSKG